MKLPWSNLSERQRARLKRKVRRYLIMGGTIAAGILILVLVVLLFKAIFFGGSKDPAADTPTETIQIGPNVAAAQTELAPYGVFYDHSMPVPATVDQGTAIFDKALFIGESRVEGMTLYVQPGSAEIFASGRINVDSALDYTLTPYRMEAQLALRALLAGGSYDSVYLQFGINEMGWQNTDVFFTTYSNLIVSIRTMLPDAAIYVQSIVPVGADYSMNHDYITNGRIAEFNILLQKMCEEQEVYFLDLDEVFADATGALKADMTSDGFYLTKAAYESWYTYLRTHVVQD